MLNNETLARQLEDLEAKIDFSKKEQEIFRKQYNKVEKDLYNIMKEMPVGSHIIGNELCSVIYKQDVCSVDSWPIFLNYVLVTGNFKLINKTVSNKHYRELLSKGCVVRGTSLYKKLGIKLVSKSELSNDKH